MEAGTGAEAAGFTVAEAVDSTAAEVSAAVDARRSAVAADRTADRSVARIVVAEVHIAVEDSRRAASAARHIGVDLAADHFQA